MSKYSEEKEKKHKDKDEKYIVFDAKKGRDVFDSKRAWYDAVAKCNKVQIKEVNRSLKQIGISQSVFRIDFNQMYARYMECRFNPDYGPSIWTLSGMLSGTPPTTEDMRNQLSLIRRQRFQERLLERHQTPESE